MMQFSQIKSLLMPDSASSPSSLSAITGSLRALADRFLHLAMLEGKQAGISLALMVGFAVAAAVLVITAWLALVGGLVTSLAGNDLVSWPVALLLAALLCLAGAGGLVYLIVARSKDLLFPATRRQLKADSFPRAHDE